MNMFARWSLLCAFFLAGSALSGLGGCGGSSKGGVEGGLPVGIDGAPPTQGGGGAGGSPLPGGGGILGGGGTAVLPGLGGTTAGGSGGSTMPACGQPGTPCCDGNSCQQGGCCVLGICLTEGGVCVGAGDGICNAGACGACGGPGLPCCGSNPASGLCTAPGTTCSAGSCTRCGDLGQVCCGSASGGTGVCSGQDAICSGGICRVCGTAQTPCCPGDRCSGAGCCYESVCVGETMTCGTSGGTCQSGRCSGCGNASQPCCGDRCYEGLLCKAGACTLCGSMGQPCCSSSTGAAVCQAGAACTSSGADGLCARCGNLGDICCEGGTCGEGCCSGGRCLAGGSCPGTQDGGAQIDAPIGGAGGVPGTGGIAGAGGGVGGAGGTVLPPWTPPPGCGDGAVVAPERCDDGNTMPFDGCSPDCQFEPVCSGPGPCTSRCGDGVVVGEECDDGNTKDGDGCSSACKLEAGWSCSQVVPGTRILVPAIYRDFRFKNPTDFEGSITGVEKASPGMVEAVLDVDGKPVYTGLTGTGIHVASKDTFATWYRTTADLNHATAGMLALWDNGAGAFVNRYGKNGERWPVTEQAFFCGASGYEEKDSLGNPIPCTYAPSDAGPYATDCSKARDKGYQVLDCKLSGGTYTAMIKVGESDGTPAFFPVDGDTFTPSSELMSAQIPPQYLNGKETWPYDVDADGKNRKHNFSFTSEIRYWFKYEADKSFKLDIAGDDDVWVFVNKQLAVDLGGVHTPVEGSVTLDASTAPTFGLTTGNVYEVAVFQAERQSTSSTFKITLSGFSTAPSQCVRN